MTDRPEHHVTLMLDAVQRGDAGAADDLLPVVYAELRRLAQHLMQGERPGQTLEATALVHEAYLRLVGSEGAEGSGWEGRRHFFNAAAMAMRRTLIDRARRKGRVKHGGDAERQDLDPIDIPAARHFDEDQFEGLDGALDELRAHNERWADVVHARLFLGLTIPQTAELVGVSPATTKADYRFALAWLKARVEAN